MFVDNTNCTTSHKPDCWYILSTDHFQDSADDEVNGADGLICEITEFFMLGNYMRTLTIHRAVKIGVMEFTWGWEVVWGNMLYMVHFFLTTSLCRNSVWELID